MDPFINICVYIYMYRYIFIYIYSVFSHSVSNVSGHICPNIFPELILPSGQYFKIQSNQVWPILSSPFIPCQVSVRSLSSVVCQMGLSIATKQVAPAHRNSCIFVSSWWELLYFLTMNGQFHLKIQLKFPFPYQGFLGSLWLRVIVPTSELHHSLWHFLWLFTVIFYVEDLKLNQSHASWCRKTPCIILYSMPWCRTL